MFKIGDKVRIISGSHNPASAHQSFVGRVGRITGVWIDLHGKPTTDVPYPWKLEISGIVASGWFATSELELFGPNPTPTPAITLIEAENVELKKQLDYYKSNRDWWIQIYMKAQRLNGTLAVKNAENDNLRHLLSEKNQLIEAMGASRVELEEELTSVKREAEENKLAWDHSFKQAMSNGEAWRQEKQRADNLQNENTKLREYNARLDQLWRIAREQVYTF